MINLMKHKLFIIGNGFALAHNSLTRFDPIFKNIVRKYEQANVVFNSCSAEKVPDITERLLMMSRNADIYGLLYTRSVSTVSSQI